MAEKKSSPGTRQTDRQKLGLVWRNRKDVSQIINACLYLAFFLLFILWVLAVVRMRHEDLKDADVGEDHDKEGAVEGDGGGEDEVAQVFSKQALPLRRRTWVI